MTATIIPHPAVIKAKKPGGSGSPAPLEKPATTRKSKSANKRRKLPRFTADKHFWPHVDTSGGPDACHPWTHSVDPGNGYGRIFGVEGLPYAHRKAWEVANGRKVPKGKYVLHKRGCDSKLCANPDHLRLGTHRQNAADACAEGRMRRHLTKDQVERIVSLRFKLGLGYTAIAMQFGVCNRTVVDICKGRTWSKVTNIACSGKSRSKPTSERTRLHRVPEYQEGAVVA